MNPTRKGKTARLPLHLREQLNRRLQDGQQGKKLVASPLVLARHLRIATGEGLS